MWHCKVIYFIIDTFLEKTKYSNTYNVPELSSIYEFMKTSQTIDYFRLSLTRAMLQTQ